MLPNSVFDLASAPKASVAAKAQSKPDAQNQKPAQAFQPMLEATQSVPKHLPSREAVDLPAKAPQIKADTKPYTDEPKAKAADSEQHESRPEPCPVNQPKVESGTKPDMQAQKPCDAAMGEDNIAGVAASTSSCGAAQTAVPQLSSLSFVVVSQDAAQAIDAEQTDQSADVMDDMPTADGTIILPDAPIILPVPTVLAAALPDAAHMPPYITVGEEASISVPRSLLPTGAAEEGGDATLTGAAFEGEAAKTEGAAGKSAIPSAPLLAEGMVGAGDKPAVDDALLKQAAAHPAGFASALNKGADGAPVASGVAQDAPAELKPGTQVNGTEKANSLVPQIGSRQPATEQTGAERFADLADAPYGLRGLGDFHQTMDRLLQDNRVQTHAMAQQQHLRPTPLQMLPIEIGMQAMRGANSFQIRLDPAELGRVDVKLEVNKQGEVSAHLIVERPETLQMLRRDSTTLQYAFEQAGLKSSQEGLSFSLKGEGQNGQNQSQNGSPSSQKQEDDPLLKTQIEHLALRRMMIPHSSIDRVI